MRILSSIWDGLSPHLIAKFYPLRKLDSGTWEQRNDREVISKADGYIIDHNVEVHAVLLEGDMDIVAGWQSPFEQMGPDNKAPALSAALQSGAPSSLLQALFKKVGGDFGKADSGKLLRELEGSTGITQLNSTQVFTGMPPIKFPLTLKFRALRNAVTEVRDPVEQLQRWVAPKFLAESGVLTNVVNGNSNLIDSIFPSKSPQLIAVRYADMLLQPMVIEAVSHPIVGPRTSDGALVSCTVRISLASLSAYDQRHIAKIYQR